MKKELAITNQNPVTQIDSFLDVRKSFIEKVNAICVEGKDFHIIKGKKSLAKGGAEKIASIFKWTAKFDKDTDSLDMLGVKPGLVAFKCSLSVSDKFVGEGRGAASLSGNAGDSNKTLKMAQKSAFIDAVLRASGLSDFFTQDLEDMDREHIGEIGEHIMPVQGYIPNRSFKKDEEIVVPETPKTEPTSEKDLFSITLKKMDGIKDAKTAETWLKKLETSDKLSDTQKRMISGILKSKIKLYEVK